MTPEEQARAYLNKLVPPVYLYTKCGHLGETATCRCGYAAILIEHNPLVVAAFAAMVEAQSTLFGAIAHGDNEHRAWLKAAIAAHFAGEPLPPPTGKGRAEAAEAALASLREEATAREARMMKMEQWFNNHSMDIESICDVPPAPPDAKVTG